MKILLRNIFFGGFALFFSNFSYAENTKVLRFSVLTSWGMPYSKFKDEKIVGGLIRDLAYSISGKLGLRPEFILLPRNRMDESAKMKLYDVRCNVTPKWVAGPDAYLWSDPLFETSDVIVGHKNSPQFKAISGLTGKKIGTVLGYIYPSLENYFKKGIFQREDAENQEAVLQKLANARNSYAVSNNLAYEYFLKTSAQSDQFAKWQIKLSSTTFYCATLKQSQVDPTKIVKVIRQLKESGAIERILQQYR